MSKIVRTLQAEIDLLEIALYIAHDTLKAAENFLSLIEKKLNTLATSPELGRLREELAPQLRSFPIGNYLIFYRPIKDGIAVIRILHGARDIEKLLDA